MADYTEVIHRFRREHRVRGNSDNTLREYNQCVRDFLDWLGARGYNEKDQNFTDWRAAGEITSDALVDFVLALKELKPCDKCNRIHGWQPSYRDAKYHRARADATIQKIARNLRVFIRFAVEREAIGERVKVTMPTVNEVQMRPGLNQQQIDQIEDYFYQVRRHRPQMNKRNRLMFWLLLETGCRIGEALAAEWEHVDFERGVLYIPAAKTRFSRYSPIDTLWHVLPGLLREARQDSGLILQTRKAQPLTYQGARRLLTTIIAKSGVSFGFHDLRRTFITQALQRGVPLAIVARSVGHRNYSTTQLYDKTTEDAMVEVYRRNGGG